MKVLEIGIWKGVTFGEETRRNRTTKIIDNRREGKHKKWRINRKKVIRNEYKTEINDFGNEEPKSSPK